MSSWISPKAEGSLRRRKECKRRKGKIKKREKQEEDLPIVWRSSDQLLIPYQIIAENKGENFLDHIDTRI